MHIGNRRKSVNGNLAIEHFWITFYSCQLAIISSSPLSDLCVLCGIFLTTIQLMPTTTRHRRQQLRVSSYDRVSSWLVSLLIMTCVTVGALVIIYLHA